MLELSMRNLHQKLLHAQWDKEKMLAMNGNIKHPSREIHNTKSNQIDINQLNFCQQQLENNNLKSTLT